MTLTAQQAFRVVSAVFNLCGRRRGAIGETVTQTEHALQAAYLARKFNERPPLVIATLCHDIAHLIPFGMSMLDRDGNDLGNMFHEQDGAEFLRNLGYPRAVTEPIRLHVLAKRFVITTNKENIGKLSAASRASFEQQGGIMSDRLMRDFEQHEYFADAMKLRNYEDQAKNVEITHELPGMADYQYTNRLAWVY